MDDINEYGIPYDEEDEDEDEEDEDDYEPEEDEEYEIEKPEDEEVNNNEVPIEFKPDIAPKLIARLYVNYTYLKELRDSDFDLKTRTLIEFNKNDEDIVNLNKGAWFVLFHNQNNVSQNYLKLWIELSRTVRNETCYLAHCNLDFEKKIYQNFITLGDKENINNPYYWARYREAPFMLVYRDGWPQGFYNGTMYLDELVDFCKFQVPEDLVSLPKDFKSRTDLRESILNRDRLILKQLALEKRKKREIMEREQEMKVNPTEQKISRAVDFIS